MSMTDPVADMITRIRNGVRAKLPKVDVPGSKLKLEIARILKDEGFVSGVKLIEDSKQNVIRVFLRYGPGMERAITELQRVSKPGCRIYCGKDQIPKVYGGLGINILSTSRGLMTGRRAAARAWVARSSATSGEGVGMSRVGKKPIDVPKDVKIQIAERRVSFQGPKGRSRRRCPRASASSWRAVSLCARASMTSASSGPSTAWRAPWPRTPSRA